MPWSMNYPAAKHHSSLSKGERIRITVTGGCFLFPFFRIFQFIFNEHFLALGLKNTHPEKGNRGLAPRLQGRLGQRMLKQVQRPELQEEQGLPCSPLGFTAAPSPGCQPEKQVSQIWSAASLRESRPVRGWDTRPPSPSDPSTQSHPTGSPQPLPW